MPIEIETIAAPPDRPITLGGSPVVSIVPLVSAETGNVRVSFDVLSYAGTLAITVSSA